MKLSRLLSTGFGAGYCPWAPGTAGAIFAAAIWCAYAYSIDSYAAVLLITIVLTAVFTILSIPAIDSVEREWGHDASRIVIDEMVGTWMALIAVPPSREWYWPLAALLLFRLFDIWKPLGCRWIDRNISGSWGVMLDDILAGIYAAMILTLFTLL